MKDFSQKIETFMDLDTFTVYMDKLKEYSEFCDKIHDVTGGSVSVFELPTTEGIALSMLETLTEDEKTGWIGYFAYQLDFGDRYEDGCVMEGDKNIPLGTTEELYNLLYDNFEDRRKA